jgi:hypothetical protein
VEGEGIQALRFLSVAFLGSLLITSSAAAQSWSAQTGSFLEPNRFATVKDLTNRSLWLEIGFGRDFLKLAGSDIGIDALVWSRLQMLSQFRFPVETADYMFGLYAVFGEHGKWRARVSHISSHRVDGSRDSIVGGPSSKYSREFVSLERSEKLTLLGIDLRGSAGLKYYFHQVTKFESSVQVPITVDARLFSFEDNPHDMFLTLSSAQGPSWPAVGAQLVLRTSGSTASSDLYIAYYNGASKAGTDAGLRVATVEAGVRLLPSLPW